MHNSQAVDNKNEFLWHFYNNFRLSQGQLKTYATTPTNDFREEVETLVLNVMNTPRHILPARFESPFGIEKNLGLIVHVFANAQQSTDGPPSSNMSWSKLFCGKMIELASNCAFQENPQVHRTALEETSDFIEAILKHQKNQNVPQNFSALLPKGIDPKQFRVIWEKLLTEQDGMNHVIMGLLHPLQTSRSDMLRFVSEDFLPELVDFISGAVTVAANNVALNKVLPELKTSELARKLVVQHLSAQGDGDDNKIFLLKSLLGVSKEKEAKESLRKQMPDVPLAVDKVVDYLVANFASSLDTLQESGRNIVERQIAGIRRQIDLSIKGVHEELQQQAADKAQEVALRAQKKEFADLQKQTYAALDALIQGALPKYLNNQQVKWENVKLSEADRNKLLFFRSEERSSDTLHNDLLDLIVVSLVASPDFTRIIEGKNPVVQQDSTGKNITYFRATDEQKQLFVREFLQTIPSDTLAAALENCAKLPETFTDYIHQREMSNLAQAIQERLRTS
ncbi:MAG: hypothetical protein ACK5UY_01745 [Holosporales bacterium]